MLEDDLAMSKYNLKDLSEIVTPPNKPVELPSKKEWNKCDTEFVVLPPDYKQFVNQYGSGSIEQNEEKLMYFFSPFSKSSGSNMVDKYKRFRRTVDLWGDETPHPDFKVFPEEGGYLPVAVSRDGANIYWRCFGKSTEWKISSLDETEVYSYKVGWIDYLVMSLKKEIESELSILLERGKVNFIPRKIEEEARGA